MRVTPDTGFVVKCFSFLNANVPYLHSLWTKVEVNAGGMRVKVSVVMVNVFEAPHLSKKGKSFVSIEKAFLTH